jgi:hypothetical protein
VVRRLPLLALAAVALAGCGGSHRAAPPTTAPATTTVPCSSPAQTRAVARLQKDLAALKVAGRVQTRDTLHGSAAANRATDRFLHDLDVSPVDNLTRNRMLDHAIASVIATCQQCFQAFEAERPIPTMAHEGTAQTCGKKP